jgi:uncharacterized membrane protein HdeD (DUF308 family)
MDAMQTLVRDRWMMVIRGGLACAFGVALLGWEDLTLTTVVALFAAYAFLDGLWTIVTATAAYARWADGWPVALEGLTGTIVGVLALGWPLRVSGDVVTVIVAWAIVTGVLEIVTAARMPHGTGGFWLFATAGLTSLSLAVLLLILPHADLEIVARLMGAYAMLFGVIMMLVTARLPRGGRRAAGAHGRA